MMPERKRFIPSRWMDRLVPIVLLVLLLGLLATLAVVLVAVLGMSAGG